HAQPGAGQRRWQGPPRPQRPRPRRRGGRAGHGPAPRPRPPPHARHSAPPPGAGVAGAAPAQHLALGCGDILATAAAMRERKLPILPIPRNYYDDLDARWELDPALLEPRRPFGILYDRDEP